MGLFKRNKVEEPKNPLGYALYKYDKIINRDLKKIIKTITLKKKLDFKRANIILEDVFYKLDAILDSISKDNLKIDYMSDKTRDYLISMIQDLKNFFEKAKANNYEPEKVKIGMKISGLTVILNRREEIKKKMKDIGSDYL
jgi:hypothetical protein